MPLQSGLTATINAPATINTNETVSLSATLTNVDTRKTLNLGSLIVDRVPPYPIVVENKDSTSVSYMVRADGNGNMGFYNE